MLHLKQIFAKQLYTMKNFIVLTIALLLSIGAAAQEEKASSSTRQGKNLTLKEITEAEALTDPMLGLRLSKSSKLLEEVKTLAQQKMASDTSKHGFWRKVEVNAESFIETASVNPSNTMALLWPVFLTLFVIWFVIRFLLVYVAKPKIYIPTSPTQTND